MRWKLACRRVMSPAAKMKRIPTHVVKERTREVSALFRSYSTHDHLVGTEQDVLVTDVANDRVHSVGHTKGYVQVRRPNASRTARGPIAPTPDPPPDHDRCCFLLTPP